MTHRITDITSKRVRAVARKIYRNFLVNSPKRASFQGYSSNSRALQCTVSYNKYGGYCVPLSSQHRPAARKILARDVHEPATIEFILSNCGNGDIVHAGTYFGDFLPALSSGVTSNAKVWAFEPNPENYRCARITLEINDIRNVALHNAGLGAKQGYSLIQTTDKNGHSLGGSSHIVEKDTANIAGKAESVQILDIDGVVGSDRKVSIIQLDVEGYEKEALTGAIKTIKRCRPLVILEVLPNSTLLTSQWFSENILSLGYQKIACFDDNSVFLSQSS